MRHIITVLFLIFYASGSHATVIGDLSARDYQTSGDASVTFDASTNLEWLDLTQTLNMSMLDTESSSYYDDFRWATETEISNLLDAVIPGTGHRETHLNPVAINNHNALSAFIGTTYTNGTINMFNGMSRRSIVSPDLYGGGFSTLSDIYHVYVADPTADCCYAETFSHETMGSWLVRDVATVPEPSTIVLMGLGLLGFGVTRRKQKRN